MLIPWNHSLATIDHYAEDVALLTDTCRDRGVAVQTIKSVARRRWGDDSGPRFSWYEPIDDADAVRRAVEFVLADPGHFLTTSSDARVLRPVLEAVAGHDGTPPDASELEADRTDFAITPLFDGAELEVI